jgi:hypothetical protein
MSEHGKNLLGLFAKAPRPGHVKTRLLADGRADRVVELYRCLVEDTFETARRLADVRVAVVCPAGDGDELRTWLGDVVVVEQTGRGLAAALSSTFEHFTAAGFRRIVAFNADTPHLPPAILERAFDTLASADVVVGPTADGGYYLVGARGAYPTLFDTTAMGTSTALEALVARAGALGLRLARTDEWYDVDVPADLERLATDLAGHPERAPRTAAFLARHHVHDAGPPA